MRESCIGNPLSPTLFGGLLIQALIEIEIVHCYKKILKLPNPETRSRNQKPSETFKTQPTLKLLLAK